MDNVIEKIIKTVPLVKLKNLFFENEVYVLLEKYNLTWSIKIKTTYWMIKTAINKWLLNKNKIILEASSWNTAISLAFLWKIYWFNVKIILPKSTASCKKKLIRSYWAEVIEINWTTDDCIKYRDNLATKNPNKYFIPNQYSNYANPDAHYNLTWPYIYENLDKIDFFVAWLGTSWTIIGTAKYLKEKNPNIKIVAVNPVERIEGLRNFKNTNIKIPFWVENKHLIDYIIDVNFSETINWIKDMLKEGYFVGISSGAIYWWTKEFLKNKKWLKGVFIAPDWGDYYIDTLMKYLDLSLFKGCK
jgi:cysteine synthase